MALKRCGSCFGLGLDELIRRSDDDDADTNFLRNAAELLEELITSCDGRCKPIRIFSAKEIAKATNNYAVERYLSEHKYSDGRVYKEIAKANNNYNSAVELYPSQYLSFEGRIYRGTHEGRAIDVPIYNCNSSIPNFPFSVINVVGVLSRINHPNVQKLVGCCLETSIPTLVFEDLSPCETLFYSIHGAEAEGLQSPPHHLSWENRLKIATETAYGLTYLHIGTASPIIHRDIKSVNILLGEDCTTVNIIGFDFSVSMPKGQTQIECEIAGTHTYIDPLYVKENLLSEKSDVYSYGVVLLEILTGKKPNTIMSEPLISSPMLPQFLESTEEEQLVSFIDTTVLKEAKKEQVIACIQLVERCLAKTWEERPEMKQVVQELWRIKRM